MSKPGTTKEEVAHTAVKFDAGKVRTHLLPVRALLMASQVMDYGAEKYAEGNWKIGEGFKWTRLLSAGDRHRKAWQLGQNKDTESGLPHLAHAIFCDAVALEFVLTGRGTDDRAVAQIQAMNDDEIDQLIFNRYNPPAKPK